MGWIGLVSVALGGHAVANRHRGEVPMAEPRLTIGIEEEFQIIDSGGELKAHIDTLLAAARTSSLVDDVRAEMLQSVVEVGTKICANVDEARAEVLRLRGGLAGLLNPEGLRIASAGTHPFSHWQDQRVTEIERYKLFEDEMQDLVRELLIFGMHVHVGIPDPEARIEVMNEARYFLPHLLALSTSSPFWLNRRTGLKSYRSVIWSRFPRSGIPPEFGSHADFDSYIELLVKTNTIDTGKSIWWDLRPHWRYPTIEFRICDAVTKVDEVICLAALVQAICAKLLELRSRNLGFRKYPPQLIHENKFRAFRHGLDGKLIDFGKQQEVPMRDLAAELVEFVDDVVDELGSRKDVEYVHTILREGTSADRQLGVHQASGGDMRAVVDHVTDETMTGVPLPA
jgi:glutamate---cysteine ligase / carboxylate-amine ligase